MATPDFSTLSDAEALKIANNQSASIPNVKDFSSLSDAEALAIANGETYEPPTVIGEAVKGVKAGWLGANKAVGSVLEYTGNLTGMKPLEDVGKTTSEYWGNAMKGTEAAVQNMTDIGNTGDFWGDLSKWAAWNVGQMGSQVAVTAPFMAAGRARDVKTGVEAIKGLITRAPNAGKDFARFAGEWARLKPMDIPIGILESGQIAEGQLEDLKSGKTKELSPIRGLAAAFVATKLEELGAEEALNKLMHGMGVSKGKLFARIGKAALNTGIGEGTEEFFQQYAEQVGIDPADITSKENFIKAVNGLGAGFVGGLFMGGAGGVFPARKETTQTETTTTPTSTTTIETAGPVTTPTETAITPVETRQQKLSALTPEFFSEIEASVKNGQDAQGNPFTIDTAQAMLDSYMKKPGANLNSAKQFINLVSQLKGGAEVPTTPEAPEATIVPQPEPVVEADPLTTFKDTLQAGGYASDIDMITAKSEIATQFPDLIDDLNKAIIDHKASQLGKPIIPQKETTDETQTETLLNDIEQIAPPAPSEQTIATPGGTANEAGGALITPPVSTEIATPEGNQIANDTSISYPERVAKLKKMAVDGTITEQEFGKLITEMPGDVTATKGATQAKGILDGYDNGNETIGDVAKKLENSKDANIRAAVDEYNKAVEVDFREYGQRSGLPEVAGEKLISTIRQAQSPVVSEIVQPGATSGGKQPSEMTGETLRRRYPSVPDDFFDNVDTAILSDKSMPRQNGRNISASNDSTLLHEAGHMREDLLAPTPELEAQWKAIHEKEMNKGPWGDRPGNFGGSPNWMWEDLLEIFGIYHKKASGHGLSAKEISALDRNPEAVKYVSTNLSKSPEVLKDYPDLKPPEVAVKGIRMEASPEVQAKWGPLPEFQTPKRKIVTKYTGVSVANKGKQNLVTRLIEMGKVRLGEYSDKTGDSWSRAHGVRSKDRSREMGDIAVVSSKTGKLTMDEAAANLNAEGYRHPSGEEFTADSLFEVLADGKGRSILTPEKADVIMERKQRREIDAYAEEQARAALEAEGIDAGRIETSRESVGADILGVLAEEGLSETELATAATEVESFFDSLSKPKKQKEVAQGELGGPLSEASTFSLTPGKGEVGDKLNMNDAPRNGDIFALPPAKPEAKTADDRLYEKAKSEFDQGIANATPEEKQEALSGFGIAAMKFATRYTNPKENQELYTRIYNIYYDHFNAIKEKATPNTEDARIEKMKLEQRLLAMKRELQKEFDKKEAEKASTEDAGTLQDFGEKIGGARKDTAERGYTMTGKEKREDAGPVWRKKYVAMEKLDGTGWTIGKTGDKYGLSARASQTFATQEEAEAAIPAIAVQDSHRVYGKVDGGYSIFKRVGEKKLFKVVNQEFTSREDATGYMVEHAEEILNLKTTFGEEILPTPEIAVRKGVERRTTDATPEMFMETFAPRGIEFGNWNNQDERQQVLNHAYDGLLDLADALGLPPKALMLNGELAIAFGARGQGLSGAKAHYERDYGIINLTKMSGAGALAHEWMHSVDAYLGRQDTKAKSEKVKNARGDMVYPAGTPGSDYLSHGASYKSQLRTELKDAFTALMESMYKKAQQYVEDTQQADKFVATARENLKTVLNGIRTDLTQDKTNYHKSKGGYLGKSIKFLEPASTEHLAEFDRLANILIEGGDLETKFMSTDPAPGQPALARRRRSGIFSGRQTNDTLESLNAILKAARDRSGFRKEGGFLDHVRGAMNTYRERLKMFSDAQAGTEKTKKVPTSYAIEAKKMDQARTSDYWSEPHEMAARAFAAYVEDKIAEKGGQSDFLVYHAHGGILLPMIDGFVARPYPEGAERTAINKLFDTFVNEIKTRETDKGTQMYMADVDRLSATKQDATYLKAVESGDLATAQKMVDEKLAATGAMWHGTPSGDLRGGMTGLHVGTKQAAMEALEARIGIPADGKGWDGTREYGGTLLAGRDRVASGQFGEYRNTGYNANSPREDFYAKDHEYPTVGNSIPVDPKWKPWIRPVLIVGEMSNYPRSAMADQRANGTMRGMLKKGSARRGYFYKNEGEDSGSISAVLPNGESVRVKLPDPVTYDDNGDIIPLSERFNEKTSDIRYMAERDPLFHDLKRSETEQALVDAANSLRQDEKRKGYTPEQIAVAYEQATGKPFPYRFLFPAIEKLGTTISFNAKKIERRGEAAAVYDPKRNQIIINEGTIERSRYPIAKFEEVVSHEAIHAIVIHLRETNRPAYIELKHKLNQFMEEVQQHKSGAPYLVQRTIDLINERNIVDEIVNLAFTNKEFATWLNSIPATEGVKQSQTLWGKLKEIILNVIGKVTGNTTKLDELNQIMDSVMGIGEGVEVGGSESTQAEMLRDEVENIINTDAPYEKKEQTDPPPKDAPPSKIKEWIKDETDAILQTAASHLPKNQPALGFLEKLLKSPEYYDHPVLNRIVRLFARDRNEIYHEYLNHLLRMDDPSSTAGNVNELAVLLKNKGLTIKQRLTGEASDDYKLLTQIIDEGDTMWVRDHKRTLEEQIQDYEDHIRKQGASEEVIKIWKYYRESYDRALDLMTQQMREMMNQIEEEAAFRGIAPAGYSAMYETLKGALASMEEWKGFYAPRQRQGNWVISASRGEGEDREYYREHKYSQYAARKMARKLEREGWEVKPVTEIEKLPEDVYQDVKTANLAATIEHALENMKSGKLGTEMQGMTLKFNEEVLHEVADMIRMRGFRSSMIHRKAGAAATPGYQIDPIERHVTYSNNVARGLAKAQVARAAYEQLLGTYLDGRRMGGIDAKKESRAYVTAEDYIREQLRNLDKADRVIGWAKSVATLKFLGFNARSVLVNMTSMATTAPVAIHQYAMGGKGSMLKVGRYIGVAGKDYAKFMAGKFMGTADEMRFLQEEKRLGWDDPQYTRDALAITGKVNNIVWNKLMNAAMWGFGTTEQWNRGATMLAAFRLARKDGKSFDAASEIAKNTSDKAHGIYGRSTLPAVAWGNNPSAKVAQMMYVYSKFSHNYLQMLYETGIKKGNLKATLYGMISPIVLGGIAAVPFKDATLIPLIKMIAVAAGLMDKDEDLEKTFWKWTRSLFGDTTEIAGRYGALGALGFDISGSLAIGVGVPKDLTELMGPIGGVLKEVGATGTELKAGNVQRAAEHILPSGLANIARSYRESQEGVTSAGRKNRVWDEHGKPFVPTTGETVKRAFGFRSARQAALTERLWEGKRQAQGFQDEKGKIYEAYRVYLADPKRDFEAFKEIKQDVRAFNKKLKDLNLNKEVAPITYEAMRTQANRMKRAGKRERAMLE